MAIQFLVAGRQRGDPTTDEYWNDLDQIQVMTEPDEPVVAIIREAQKRGIPIIGETPDLQRKVNEILSAAN